MTARRRAILSDAITASVAAFLFICLLIAVAGCGSTVTPNQVEASAPSFDGNAQNSGIIAIVPGGRLVTQHFRDRYDALVEYYGRDFTPPIKPREGFTPSGSDWVIDLAHYVKFLEMNQWLAAGLKPLK